MNSAPPRSVLLLLEPDYMLRHTVALTARSAGLAIIQEAASVDTAAALLRTDRFDGALFALDDEAQVLQLIDRLRQGKTLCAPEVPIAVMVGQCSTDMVMKLQVAGINQIVLRPFKVKTLLATIQTLSAS